MGPWAAWSSMNFNVENKLDLKVFSLRYLPWVWGIPQSWKWEVFTRESFLCNKNKYNSLWGTHCFYFNTIPVTKLSFEEALCVQCKMNVQSLIWRFLSMGSLAKTLKTPFQTKNTRWFLNQFHFCHLFPFRCWIAPNFPLESWQKKFWWTHQENTLCDEKALVWNVYEVEISLRLLLCSCLPSLER